MKLPAFLVFTGFFSAPATVFAATDQAALIATAPAHLVVGLKSYFVPDGSLENCCAEDSYEWDFGDGNKGSGKKSIHVFAKAGKYKVTLSTTDARGVVNTASISVNIEAVKLPKIRLEMENFIGNKTSDESYELLRPTETLNFSIDDSASQTMIERSEWDFGDGVKEINPLNTEYTFFKPGTYTVKVKGRDGAGNYASASMKIIVPPVCPIEEASGESDYPGGCLWVYSSNSDIIPRSHDPMIVENSYRKEMAHKKLVAGKPWLEIVVEENMGTTRRAVDISKAAKLDDGNIAISLSELDKLHLDYRNSFHLVLGAETEDGKSYDAESGKFYIGVGSVSITTLENNISISAADSRGARQLYFEKPQKIVLNDLVLGPYALQILKENASEKDRLSSLRFDLKNGHREDVIIGKSPEAAGIQKQKATK